MGREPRLDLFAERLVTNAGFVEKQRALPPYAPTRSEKSDPVVASVQPSLLSVFVRPVSATQI
jgi:hypothetical protein